MSGSSNVPCVLARRRRPAHHRHRHVGFRVFEEEERVDLVRVDVSAIKLSVPNVCSCCLGQATTSLAASATRTTGKRVVRSQTHSWSFPFCDTCLGHLSAWKTAWGFGFAAAVVAVSVAFAAVSKIGSGELAPLVAFAVGLISFVAVGAHRKSVARSRCSSSCASSGLPVAYLGWHGTVHAFNFSSSEYAGRFAEANARKVVN